MVKYDAAEVLVEILNANGVDQIFINPGYEAAPIQATVAKLRSLGKRAPQLVLCIDESVAMAAAHGDYMVSKKPQVVMVHSELGTLQLGGALHNIQWGRVPIIIMAGVSPADQRLTWKQEPFDQNSIVRNNVKWDNQMRNDEDISDIIQKAFQIACTEPCGPVYLSHSWDLLYRKVDRSAIIPANMDILATISLEIDRLSKMADILIEAKRPLIVLGHTGRFPQSMDSLITLAETLCAPVLTSQVWMNFPTTHPLCAGIEQIAGSRKGNPYMADADVVLVIDYTMPYALAGGLPRAEAKILHIDVDPLTQGRLLWGRGADVFIKADSRRAIPILNQILNQRLTHEKRAFFHERFKQLDNAHKKQRDGWRALALNAAKLKPISSDWLSYCIAQVINEDTILLNHTISHSASVTEQIDRTKTGTLLGCPGGSISWALGAALGAKIAAPDKTVVSLMTDGGFVWSCPVATLWSAKAYHAPFMAIIFDNQGYGIARSLVKKTLGVDDLSDEMAFETGTEFRPLPDYAKIAQGCGAYGRAVEDPDDIILALKEAMAQVLIGIPAVLDFRLGRA